MDNDYMKDLKIDENNLHVECMIQPQLYMKYAEMYAIASKKKSRLKNQLDVLESQLDNKYRVELQDGKRGEIKITEKVVHCLVVQDKEHEKACKEYLDAEFEENIYKDAKMAFQDRKLQLGNLTDLFISGYFSKPSKKTKLQNVQQKHRENLIRGEE